MKELTLRANPYVGLRPFFERDSLYFFGRSEQAADLLEILHRERFLGVVGSSGSGKSSLIRAGLLPRLLGGFLVQDRDRWRIVRLKPGDSPLGNLARALVDATRSDGASEAADASALEQQIRDDHTDAVAAFLRARTEPNANVFVLVDQFEEIFAFRGSQDEASQGAVDQARWKERARRRSEAADFVDILLDLARRRDLPIYVALAMRTDFLGECDLFYGLPEVLNRGRYLVPRLTRQQLREAIEGPAMLLGTRIEARLLDHLLNELGDRFDRLPVLQHALLRTWDAWRDMGAVGPIDFPHYDRAGGLERALDRDAERACDGLERDAISAIFRRLTDTDVRARRTRSPARVSQLVAVSGASRETVNGIVRRFEEGGRSFVYTADDGQPDDPWVDISHESLIRQWDRLRDWVDAERQSRDSFRELTARAHKHDAREAALLQDPELRAFQDWRDAERPSAAWADRYSQTSRDYERAAAYLDASVDAKCEALAETELAGRWKVWNPMILLAVMGLALLTEYSLSSPPVVQKPVVERHQANAPGSSVATATTDRTLHVTRVGELDWTAGDRGRTLDWRAAAAYCDGLVAGDRSDWRLPSTSELLDLYEASADASGGARMKAPFRDGVAARYLWSEEVGDDAEATALAGDFRQAMFVPLPVGLANEAGALCVASPPPADRAEGLADKRRGVWDELTKYTPLGAFVLLYLVLAWAGRKAHRTLALPGILRRIRATGGRRPDEPGSDQLEAAERHHTAYGSTGRRLAAYVIDLAVYLGGVAAVALVLIIVQDVPVTVTKPSGEVVQGVLDENDDKTVALITADGTRQVFPLNPGPRLRIVGGVKVPATLPSGTVVEGRSFEKLQVVVTLPSEEQIEGTLASLAPDRVVLRTAAGAERSFAIDQNLPDVVIDWPPSDAGLAGFIAFMVALSWLYNSVQLSSPARATLGMRALGIFRTDLHGNALTFGRASGWFGYRLLSYLAYGLGFLSQPFTKRRQTFHDWMAGSVVLRKPR